MKNTVWILTEEHNQYDQYGEYFIEAFKNKPNPEQLKGLSIDEMTIQHVLNGGGRQKSEDRWFYLREKELK